LRLSLRQKGGILNIEIMGRWKLLEILSVRRESLDDLNDAIFIRFRHIVLAQLILLYIGVNVGVLAKRGLCIIS
jgi:hypothetical protein